MTKNAFIPWHDCRDFWVRFAPLVFSGSATDGRLESEIEFVSKRVPTGGRILDLCCGSGKHCLGLAQRGFQVSGTDHTLEYLELAASRAEQHALTIEWILGDMRSLNRPGYFACITCFGTSFGWFRDVRSDRRVVRNVFRSLARNGIFILDVVGKEITARDFAETAKFEHGDICMDVKRTVLDNWTWIEDTFRILEGGKCEQVTTSYRPYSAAEMTALLASCGFRRIKIFGSSEGSPYDHRAERLIAVARK